MIYVPSAVGSKQQYPYQSTPYNVSLVYLPICT
jgi:hypothetical protein